MAYISRADVKTYLRANTTDDDSLIDALITRAQRFIEDETGRVFEHSGAATTKQFDALADVHGALLLLNKDCFGITAVTNGDGTSITSSMYVTEPRDGGDGTTVGVHPFWAIKLLSSSGHLWTYQTDPENAISVTAKWAYSSVAPTPIAQATLELVAYLYRRRDTSIELDRPIEVGGMAILPSSIPKSVREVVNLYKRGRFAAVGG